MTEAHTSIEHTMLFYQNEAGTRRGAHMPFNFHLIYQLQRDMHVSRFRDAINVWWDHMPAHHTANWVASTHDHERVGSRIGVERIDLINTILMTLPGASITYYGDEIGMLDIPDLNIYDNRDRCRTPMQWDATVSSGFSTNTSTWLPVHENYLTLNVAQQKDVEKSHYNYFKRLSSLKLHETMISGEYIPRIFSEDIFAYTR